MEYGNTTLLYTILTIVTHHQMEYGNTTLLYTILTIHTPADGVR